jgi:fluoride exporter
VRTIIGIGVAGALGALSRYGVEGFVSERFPGSFPAGTFVINVTGSFVLGFLFVLLTERVAASATLRTSLTVGFVGAYTTFSTFSFETLRLIEDGALRTAAVSVVATLILGLLAVWAGMTIGRAI